MDTDMEVFEGDSLFDLKKEAKQWVGGRPIVCANTSVCSKIGGYLFRYVMTVVVEVT
ncbi:MAG: hypothetical protein WC827_00015 [Candidatus Paceibacterota bacterium]|jgi:hypothetical protein